MVREGYRICNAEAFLPDTFYAYFAKNSYMITSLKGQSNKKVGELRVWGVSLG
jgi:hypothetical protein